MFSKVAPHFAQNDFELCFSDSTRSYPRNARAPTNVTSGLLPKTSGTVCNAAQSDKAYQLSKRN
jgi:hypothetical protein